MNDIIDLVVNNGLGIASFVAMLYFINNTTKNTNDCLKEISQTLLNIQIALASLNERVSSLEKDKE